MFFVGEYSWNVWVHIGKTSSYLDFKLIWILLQDFFLFSQYLFFIVTVAIHLVPFWGLDYLSTIFSSVI